ncbi:hypothetical protein TVAG_109890 [Trichomonas vaginalis G3]|uniref:I/LWEQ domain-containing protein n=1 Tax=Trichomonas vaginalis (strain ATCC PRA-98 / G3) TaxID=412133 RepID=A2DGJ0_TRIV3|nr:hypothetical protein TVAGG3_0998300 [Trichomonas vaginalis G3]EAY20377.1 hypothetical protein TVAG_109890 [Trichomonas vaginalis G3]KAI5490575.1 hypothetical protein TVAGG3_0998300 [Trichomonas vaginalis G3]|eukprot:XP_001581363.1 hypothetical protein [Trichomonas vaginalis G3]
MTAFSNFITNLSRFHITDPDSLVKTSDIAALTTPAGLAAVRANFQINTINDCVNQFSELVKLISNGPQQLLSNNYAIISDLYPTAIQAVEIIDNFMPEGYKCSGFMQEAFSNIQQFSQYIPQLTSPTATTYAQYIPQFQETFQQITNIISQVLPVVQSVPGVVSQNAAPVDTNDKQIHRIAALIQLNENIFVDLVKFKNDPVINTNETMKKNIDVWLLKVNTFANTLVSLMGNNSVDLFKACSEITNPHTSIVDTFNSVLSLSPHCSCFTDASSHLMTFIQILSEVQFFSTNAIADKASNIIAQSVSAKEIESIQAAIKQISYPLSLRPELLIYGPVHPELISFINSVLQVNDSDPDMFCITSTIILTLYAVTCGQAEFSYKLLSQAITQCVKLLSVKCSAFRQLAATASTIISANEAVFDTKKLALMNYYLNSCLSAKIVDVPTIKSLQPIFISVSALPAQIENISEGTETKEKFADCVAAMKTLGATISHWLIITGLTISAMIINKADILVNLLAYISSAAQVQNPATSLVTLLQGAPHYIFLDISSSYRLDKSFNDLEQTVKAISQQTDAQIISEPVKVLFDQAKPPASVLELVYTDDTNNFSGLLFMVAQRLIGSLKLSQESLDKNIGGFLFNYSFALSYSQYSSSAVEVAPQIMGSISTFPATIKGYNDVIYPASIALSPTNTKDVGNLKVYIAGVLKSAQEMQTAILAMPQPSKTYEISEELKAIRAMQAQNQQLSQNLRPFGEKIISRAVVTPTALPILTPFFQVASEQPYAILKVAKSVADYTYSMISGKSAPELLMSILRLMVSCAVPNIEDLSKHTHEVFDFLLNALVSFTTEKEKASQNVRLIYAKARQVTYMAKYITVKEIDAPPFVHASIANVVMNLAKLQSQFNVDMLCSALGASSCYIALAMLFPDKTNDIVEFIHVNEILSTITRPDAVLSLIKQVAEIFANDSKNAFSSEIDENNKSLIIDLLYEHFEELRFSANVLIKCISNPGDTEEYLNSTLRQFMISCSSYMLLVSKGINRPDYVLQRIIETVNCLLSFAAISKGGDESKSLDFRRGNRIVSRQIDTTINMMESPNPETTHLEGFKLEMNNFYITLIKVLIECVRRVSASLICLHKDTFQDTTPMLTVAYNKMNEAFNICRDHAIGKTKKPFIDSFKQLTSTIEIFSSTQMDYSLQFPPLPIIEAITKLVQQVSKFLPTAALATDVLIIDPDPVAASRVPEFNTNITVPTLTSEIAPTDALADQSAALKAYNEALQKFNQVYSNEQATSEELLDQAEKFKISCDNYIKNCMIMAQATQEKGLQVAQQTNAHAIAGSVAAIMTAVRSRLLREKDFKEQMTEAQSQLKDSIDRQQELATQGAAYVPPDPDADLPDVSGGSASAAPDDEVSAELQATASAISDMSNRLAMFSNQIGASVVIDEEIPDDIYMEEDEGDQDKDEGNQVEIDIKAEEGSMAAHIIACATPIMITAGEILERSQQICREMRGKIHNEAFIIKCAHDVTEAAQLLIIAAEIAVNGSDPDPEFVAIAASNMVKTAIASIVAQVLQSGGDSEQMMKKTRTVRFYCLKINQKLEAIAKQKWIAANPIKKGAKMVQKMNAMNELKQYQETLDNAEKARKMFKRK